MRRRAGARRDLVNWPMLLQVADQPMLRMQAGSDPWRSFAALAYPVAPRPAPEHCSEDAEEKITYADDLPAHLGRTSEPCSATSGRFIPSG